MEELREECEKRGMEVKFGQSPIEVKRVNYRHRISDDTHDKVYELNKQMCDLEIDRDRWEKIGKEWASKNKEIVLSILKGNDMEKKKMTKTEAFQWLKCKKVSVANREINNKVQSKLFACGVEWKYHGTDVCYYGNYLVINPEGFLCHCDGMGSDYWSSLFLEEISADDILSIEIVEDTKPDCERNEHVKALQELIAKSGCIDCIIISKNDIGILKK